LLKRAQAGDLEARNRLVTGNLGLIILAIHRNLFDDELKKDISVNSSSRQLIAYDDLTRITALLLQHSFSRAFRLKYLA
jgi:hypothetical protein